MRFIVPLLLLIQGTTVAQNPDGEFPAQDISPQQVPGTIGGLDFPGFSFSGNLGSACVPFPEFWQVQFGSNEACIGRVPPVLCSYEPQTCRLEPGTAFYQTTCFCDAGTEELPGPGQTCVTRAKTCEDVPIETDCPRPQDRGYLVETGDRCDFSALPNPDKVCRINPIACPEAQSDSEITFSRICTCEDGFFNCTDPSEEVECLRNSEFNARNTPETPQCARANIATGNTPSGCQYDYQNCKFAPRHCPNQNDIDPRFVFECECLKGLYRCNEEPLSICGEPTNAPTDPPTFAPTLGPIGLAAPPGPTGNDGLTNMRDFCFPKDARVRVLQEQDDTVEEKLMGDLSIGDLVQVNGNDKFEPIYSFGHRNAHKQTTFVEVNKSLRLSPHHLIWKENSHEYVAAKKLQVGDVVLAANDLLVVESIRQVTAKGVYAPFTPSGTLVVNDIVTSCYANVLVADSSIMRDNTFHHLAHSFQFPHRLACHYWSSCPNETYTQDGISTWMARPLQLIVQHQTWSNNNSWVVLLMTASMAILMPMFAVAEFCLLNSVVVVVMLAGASMVLCRQRGFKVKSV